MTENIYPSRPIGAVETLLEYLVPHIEALQNLEKVVEKFSPQGGIFLCAAENTASRRVEETRVALFRLGLGYLEIDEAVDQLRNQTSQSSQTNQTESTTKI